MWIRTDGWGMTDDVVEQVRKERPLAPAIQIGQCATWLNLNTGARMLHVHFGAHGSAGRSHGVFYRSPIGELSNVAFPVSRLYDEELGFAEEVGPDSEMIQAVNLYRWRQVNHSIEKALELRADEFSDEWPGR
jgi:hypothetical protein